MSDEARKELKLAAISLGCAVLLLAIIMVAIAVVGTRGGQQPPEEAPRSG